jgi:hypothetical protein
VPQIGAGRDADNRIGLVLEHRTGAFFPGATAGTAIDQAVRPCVVIVWRAMGGDLHDMRVVLGQPRIDAQDVCF